jgi:hypothetical protein
MAISLHEMLQPQVILRVVSRIRQGQNRLGRWLGFHPTGYNAETVSLTGPNIVQGDTRYATFRYFDWARTVGIATSPGTGPISVAPNPTGDTRVTCARFHMKIPLLYEDLGNLSPIVGPNSNIDQMGQDYVMRQVQHLTRRMNNTVELMSTGMLQDSLYFVFAGGGAGGGSATGVRIWPQLAAPTASQVGFQVPFQIPAGNKNQLNMLGTGNIITIPWNNLAAPLMKNLAQIEAAFAQLSGYSVTDTWLNSLMWYNVILNTEVRNTAGSANTPFAEFDRVPEKGADGEPTGEFYMILRGYPEIRWHITNHVLVLNSDIDPSYATAPAAANIVKMVPDNMVFFCTTPSSEWTQMYNGGEPVVENPGMPAVLRRGYYFWKEYVTQPSAVDLLALLNAVPLLFIPKAAAPATVVF